MAENRTFTLVGKFDDQISKKLKEINKVFSEIRKSTEGFGSDVGKVSKSINKMTSSLEDAGKAAGKVRDTVSQIGEGVKGLDGIGESLDAAARAAGRAQDEVLGIGEAAGRANRQADDLMTTLLKAEGLSKFGDAMAQGLNRGMNVVMSTVQKGAGLTAKLFKDAMEDEMADIKAASGIQGSFALAGFKGDFRDSERMYKKYDQVVSEMIRQSSAPTAKVVELQRYTLDTMGPLMLAAQGVKKGTAMKDIDPKKIQASATQYGQFLEKAALFSQGTGSAGFRVAAGIEGLVTRGKIDTTIDFFTDNIMLMKNLEAAGFAGRGMRSSKLMNATDAQRMAAMMEAFNKSMSSESTKAMASSLTGSLQGLQDTIFNPSVGILGMSVTFSKEEQKKANASIRRIQNERIGGYTRELNNVKTSEERKKQLRINIEQAEITRDQLIKDDVISTPFKAFSYAFSNIVRKLTEALNAIGPVWTNFAVAAIEVTNKVFGPLGETLGNVASDMRAKKVTQAEGFGRIIGEVFKTIGQIMGDLANMINDPNSAMGKVQSEFMKGFMSAFKDPGMLRSAQEGIKSGLSALIGKFFEFLWKAITFEPIRPLMLLFVAGIFGPALIGAVIAGATPLIISAIGRMMVGSLGRGGGSGGGGLGAFITPGGARAARGLRGGATFGRELMGLGYGVAGRPGLRAGRALGGALGGVGNAVGKVGRYVPGGALAFGAIDAGMRMASGQDAGRAIGGAAATTIGATLGGILGQALIPIPGVGAAVGGIAGGIIGDKVGSFFMGPAEAQSKAADAQKLAAAAQLEASRQQNERITGVPLGGAEAFVNDPGKLFRAMKALGLSDDPKARELLQASGNLKEVNARAAAAADKLNAIISFYKRPASKGGLGYTPEQIANQTDYRAAQNEFKRLADAAKIQATSVKKLFTDMPPAVTKQLTTVLSKVDDKLLTAVLAAKLGQIEVKIPSIVPSGPNPSTPDSLFTIQPKKTRNIFDLSLPPSSTKEKKGEGWPLSQYSTKNWGEGCSIGSLGGSRAGSVDAFNSVASAKGLRLTSGYRPGSKGWHGINRARDYSNGYSPTPQMLAFATHMAQNYGSNLRELIYTPLGFSIKNGQKVPPYAAAGHYNHVHVAYAMGAGTPAFFSSQREAMAWENKATLGNVKVSSITSNSSEGMGAGMTVNAPITIHQQPGQNSEQLASLVAMELANAIRQARSSSMYV